MSIFVREFNLQMVNDLKILNTLLFGYYSHTSNVSFLIPGFLLLITRTSAQCLGANGQFPVNNCRSFVTCVNFQPIRFQNCRRGRQFDVRRRRCRNGRRVRCNRFGRRNVFPGLRAGFNQGFDSGFNQGFGAGVNRGLGAGLGGGLLPFNGGLGVLGGGLGPGLFPTINNGLIPGINNGLLPAFNPILPGVNNGLIPGVVNNGLIPGVNGLGGFVGPVNPGLAINPAFGF